MSTALPLGPIQHLAYVPPAMLTKVTLKQFRGIKSLSSDLRPITAVVGRNSSGKTTILYAVRLAIDALAIALDEGTPQLGKDGAVHVCHDLIVQDFARLCPVDTWAELFTDGEVSEGTKLSIAIELEPTDLVRRVEVSLSCARNHQLKMAVDAWSDEAVEAVAGIAAKSKHRPDRLREVLRRGAPRAVFVPAFYGVTRAEEYRSRALVGRLLGGGDQSRIVRNLVARLDGPALERMKDFLRRSVGATIESRTTAQDAEAVQHLKVHFSDTNGRLELSSAGAGLVNLIALYAAMEEFRPTTNDRRPVVFLLDEPEAHLHPKLQGDVGEALGALAAEFGSQLIIATHSVEMINRLGQRADSLLLAIDRATSTVTPMDSDAALMRELAQFCDLTPFASINFLASKRILFHEGPTDAAILSACAAIYFRSDATKYARFKTWALVSLDGVGNIKAQGVLGAVLTPTLFPHLATKETVQAICVLDRDAEREPGLRSLPALTKPHFDAREQVWSRHSIESLFLDPACLAAWVRAAVPMDAASNAELVRLAQEGLAVADKDTGLLDAAEAALLLSNVREGKKIATALADAKKAARAEPQIWQQGRGRATVVLKHIREGLPKNLQNRVRASIPLVIEKAAVDKLGDTSVLLPAEVRALLDLMVLPVAGGGQGRGAKAG